MTYRPQSINTRLENEKNKCVCIYIYIYIMRVCVDTLCKKTFQNERMKKEVALKRNVWNWIRTLRFEKTNSQPESREICTNPKVSTWNMYMISKRYEIRAIVKLFRLENSCSSFLTFTWKRFRGGGGTLLQVERQNRHSHIYISVFSWKGCFEVLKTKSKSSC